MDFFKNKTVKIIAWILLLISTTVLIIGGVTQAEVTSVISAAVAIIAAVAELVILIGNLIAGKNK